MLSGWLTIRTDLMNKVAIVTGSSQGIGEQIAITLAKNGLKFNS